MDHFAGLDWGSTTHAACVVNGRGKVLAQLETAHTAEGLRKLLRALAEIAPAEHMPIAIERPSGLIVDTLIEAGHPVVPIHPNALKASRPRYRAAGGKSDPGDAYILADVLRTDGHRLRTLQPASDEIKALQATVRARDALVEQRVSTANQLRALLESFWPGAVAVFGHIETNIALAFIDRYPTPASARHLGPKRMAAFLTRHGYTGRQQPEDLLARLRAAPSGLAGETEQATKGAVARSYVSILQPLMEQIKTLTKSIEDAVAELETGQVLMSLPQAGRVNAAQILAEIGDDPTRFQSEDQLAAEAGVAPVTQQSGKHRSVKCRYACNKRLRRAITMWANNSRRSSEWAADIYSRARSKGYRHPHAIRILARAWIRVLWRCWQDKQHYDPALHGNTRPFVKAA